MPAAIRPRLTPDAPKPAITMAAIRGSTIGATTAADGIQPSKCRGLPAFESVERLLDRVGPLLEGVHDLTWRLGLEIFVGQPGLDLRQIVLQPPALLLAPRVAATRRELDAPWGD